MSLDRQCVQRDLSVSECEIHNIIHSVVCSTLYIGISKVFVFTPYIYIEIQFFDFQVNSTFIVWHDNTVIQTAPCPTCLPLWLR